MSDVPIDHDSIIRFTDTYLWDFFAIMAFGFLVYLEWILFFGEFNFLKNSVSWVAYVFLFYFLGLCADALIDFFYKLFFKRFFNWIVNSWLFSKWMKNTVLSAELLKEKDSTLGLVREKLTSVQSGALGDENVVVRARLFLELHHIPLRYLSFFSKHRFYKNLSLFFFLNALVMPFFVDSLFLRLGIFFCCIFVALIMFLFSEKFWIYSSNEVCQKFLMTQVH